MNRKAIFGFVAALFFSQLAFAQPQHFYAQVQYYPGTQVNKNFVYFSAEQLKLVASIGQEFLDCGDDQLVDASGSYSKICEDGKVIFPMAQTVQTVFSKVFGKPAQNIFKVELRPFTFEGLNLAGSEVPAQLLAAQYFLYVGSEKTIKFLGTRVFFLPPRYINNGKINESLVEKDLKKQRLIMLLDLPTTDPATAVALKKLTDSSIDLSLRGTINALKLIETLPSDELSPEIQQMMLNRCAGLMTGFKRAPENQQKQLIEEISKFPFLKPLLLEWVKADLDSTDQSVALKAALLLAPEITSGYAELNSPLAQKVRAILAAQGINPADNQSDVTAKSIEAYAQLQVDSADQLYLLGLLQTKEVSLHPQILQIVSTYIFKPEHLSALFPLLLGDNKQLKEWAAEKINGIDSAELQLKLVPFLKHSQLFVAQFAFQYLDNHVLSSAVLTQLADSSYVAYTNEFVRYASLYLLAKKVVPQQQKLYFYGLVDSSLRVQKVCAQALKQFNYTDEDMPLLEKYLVSSDLFVVQTAIALIGRIPGEVATWKLVKKSNDLNDQIREAVTQALSTGRMTRRSLEVLELDNYINHPLTKIRLTVVSLIGQIELPRSIRILRNRLRVESDPRVTNLIQDCLKKLGAKI